ncbi:MAG: acyl carrier protein [Bacteroidetes bacterium GWF2_38_335]|nr:MAG: acyl carrier protein [Bacteroidetes bacterium GWF2_38_335]OFY78822.1 MAG: acyl carrier protein [Bacteroidetes bacterium RIFOXYA12_FULL_38_20]HBS85219.1 acyl carrier protein [Bacteroidales bacterium]
MNVQDFILKIEEEFEDMERGKLKPESNFRDFFEWNSINALIIIALVDTEYGVTINAEDIRTSKTVSDLFQTILNKQK